MYSSKPDMVRSAPLTGAREKTYTEKVWKQRKKIIRLAAAESLVVCLGLIVLSSLVS